MKFSCFILERCGCRGFCRSQHRDEKRRAKNTHCSSCVSVYIAPVGLTKARASCIVNHLESILSCNECPNMSAQQKTKKKKYVKENSRNNSLTGFLLIIKNEERGHSISLINMYNNICTIILLNDKNFCWQLYVYIDVCESLFLG